MEKIKKITSHVRKVTPEQIAQLEQYLLDRGWQFSAVPYAHWKASHEKTNVVAYESGKLTVQGGGAEEFVTFILEPEILHEFSFGYEDVLQPGNAAAATSEATEPFTPHGGIDESGKGDFFGPLVVAGVYVDDATRPLLLDFGVKDSKVIKSSKKIHDLAGKIRRTVNGKFAEVKIGPDAYNRMYENIKNLNRMLAWGHARVIENLLEKAPECQRMLSDKFGNEKLIKNALLKNGRRIKLEQRTKAESDVAVAAASILARDGFLRGMEKLSAELNLELPRGAGAQVETVALDIARSHGLDCLRKYTKTHFKTFEKIRDGLKT